MQGDNSELLRKVVANVVDDPEGVQYFRYADAVSVVYIVRPASIEDTRRLVGRRGALTLAVERLLNAVYGRLKKKVSLHILAPEQ